MKYWKKISIPLIVMVLAMAALSAGMAFASEEKTAILVLNPSSGEPGAKLTFYGVGFIPGEKVKIIMTVDKVPFAFAVAGTGGFVTASKHGTFKLIPAGGIPTVMLKPGIYTIEAVGDQGSKAKTSLEVLKKK